MNDDAAQTTPIGATDRLRLDEEQSRGLNLIILLSQVATLLIELEHATTLKNLDPTFDRSIHAKPLHSFVERTFMAHGTGWLLMDDVQKFAASFGLKLEPILTNKGGSN